MYSPEFIEKMQRRLLEEKSNLEEQLQATSAFPEYDTESKDDVAEKTEADATNQDIIAQLTAELEKVTAALQRIDNGTYGQCLNGKELISEARLEALPWAETCLEHEV